MVTIIKQSQLEAISEVMVSGEIVNIGEYRAFNQNDILDGFLKNSSQSISFAWTKLEPNQTLPAHRHPMPSLILVCKGSGKYFGEFDADLQEGDAILVPENTLHGFTANHNEALHCLSVQSEGGPIYRQNATPRATFCLKKDNSIFAATNLSYQKAFEEICQSIQSKCQAQGKNFEKIFYGFLKRWSQSFQQILFLRQGYTTDAELKKIFAQHLEEEFGHDEYLSGYEYKKSSKLEAYCSWFEREIQILPDAGKAILVHSVLESSGEIFFNAMQGEVEKETSAYLNLHAACDGGHARVCDTQIKKYLATNLDYALEICSHSWEMIIDMFSVMLELSEKSFQTAS